MTALTSTTDSPRPTRSRRRRWLAGALTALIAAGAGSAWYATSRHHDASTHEQPMTDRAAQVMPFDLNATSHTFTKTSTGGVEQVVANNPDDTRNITVIRQHLSKEAAKSAQGDYSDPATIHGTAMPGLQELQAGKDRVHIQYDRSLPARRSLTAPPTRSWSPRCTPGSTRRPPTT